MESFTGYLARLAASNGIKTFPDLVKLLSLEEHGGTVYRYNDCPPFTLGKLATITNCSELTLLGTTFYHLVRKFNRLSGAAEVSKFLIDAITPYLRYCPLCLEQRSYYSLCWRFQSLKGCAEHNCKLLGSCGHCAKPIPLLTNPITFGSCPACKKTLGTSPILPLSKKEKAQVNSRQADLEFLLKPNPREAEAEHVIMELGKQLRRLRLSKGQSIRQVAKAVKLDPSEIFFSEEGRPKNGRALFHTYLSYVDYFGISLAELFEKARNASQSS